VAGPSIESTKGQQRSVIIFTWSEGMRTGEIYGRVTLRYNYICISQKKVYDWVIRFWVLKSVIDRLSRLLSIVICVYVKGSHPWVYPGQQKNISIYETVWNEQQSMKELVQECLKSQPKTFYFGGIRKSVGCFTKCIWKKGDYVEKYVMCKCCVIILSENIIIKLSLICYLNSY
jgi:hypothetical protein